MAAYYNDFDPHAAQWLKNLIDDGLIARGEVDERSVRDIEPSELRYFRQCHFFAGIGGWPYALDLAGWPKDREVWTGSCPCQPLSSAGQRRGHADERHLWPAFYRLIAERRPATIFGEQVASKDGREWLAGVRADLEALGYAVGAADLCAAGKGAPHIRQRLFWVAHTEHAIGGPLGRHREDVRSERFHSINERQSGERRCNETGGLGDADRARHARTLAEPESQTRHETRLLGAGEPSANFWSAAEWLPCLDGKARRIEPGTFPLAHGVPSRVGRLRGYGNAIVPQLAAEFVVAFMECQP